MNQKIIIVDKNDNVIGHKDRDSIRKIDIYRVSALWIKNSSGDSLLARRALTKSHDPGKWGPAVAGTVERGENYETNIRKEAEEEIGLNNIQPQLGPKLKINREHNYFVQWYLLKIDKPVKEFTVDHNEVEEIDWFPKEKLLGEIHNNPGKFSKTMKQYIKLFC